MAVDCLHQASPTETPFITEAFKQQNIQSTQLIDTC